MEMKTYSEWLSFATKKLSSLSSTPNLEAELILSKVLGTSRESILADSNLRITPEAEPELQRVLEERLLHKPLSLILGLKDFWKDSFRVNDQILAPRPETEMLVKLALNFIEKRINIPSENIDQKINSSINILEIGVGSGAIIISLAKELSELYPRSNFEFTGVDISENAIKISKENQNNISPDLGIDFFTSDIFSEVKNKFDLIISNPPYLPLSKKGQFAPEIDYEPDLALYSGEDGLDFYRKFIIELPNHLLDSTSQALCEIYPPNFNTLEEIAENAHLRIVKPLQDCPDIVAISLLSR